MTDIFKRARQRVVGVLAHRRTVRELSNLSDRTLEDIGISRCSIGYHSKVARYRALKQL